MLTPTPPEQKQHTSARLETLARNLPLVLVLTMAVVLAAILLERFLSMPQLLWDDPIHDRNAHLYSGLCLATDIAHGRWQQLFSDVDAFRSWPPLHDGLLVGAALLIGQRHEQWAVIPSLLGWAGTATFAFLLARRVISPGGTLAGLIAALFVLISPAQRAFATDVMLESLGACLTLACLYFSLRAEQKCSIRNARGLALALTLLFFEKYNYWLLVILALTADGIWSNRQAIGTYLRDHLMASSLRQRLEREVRQPLTWLLLMLLTLCTAISLTGGTELAVYGKHISLHSAGNLLTLAYIVFLIRIAPWYRRQGRDQIRKAEPRTQALVKWHIWPVALWLLWPQRLFSVLWVVDPTANVGTHPQHDLLGGYSYYWACMTQDYHIAAWSALTALVLMTSAILAGLRGQLRPGAGTVLWLVLLSTLLTVHHPYRDSRFLHSWIPAVWVLAGAGAASLSYRSPGTSRFPLRPILAGFIALLAALHVPALLAPAHAPEGGIHSGARSVLNITDAYLPSLAGARHAAVFANIPLKFLAQWTYLQRYERAARLETDIPGFDPLASDNTPALAHWLETTHCDTIVVVDIPAGTVFSVSVPGSAAPEQYGTLLMHQTTFIPVSSRILADSGCAVTIWRRKP